MANILDYVKWRGDITFDYDPFNVVDSLILSELAYVPFDDFIENNDKGDSLCHIAKRFFSTKENEINMGAILPDKEIKELLKLTSLSKRFKNIKIKNYINIISKKEEKQFCAMCFQINRNTSCIAFRGTDDTLVGWKENFNMSFNTPIPAQKDALEYLNKYGAKINNIYLCGHSKGGNLASYAALFMDKKIKNKIIEAHNFDGPGFRDDFLKDIDDKEIKEKTIKFLPQSSVIGMIYDAIGKCVYVNSIGKGIYQHNAFNWQILGNKFITVSELDASSIETHDLLNKWTTSMSSEERSEFVEALYKLLTVNDTATLSDIASDKYKFILGVLKSDGKTKKVFLSAINRLIKEKYILKADKSKK